MAWRVLACEAGLRGEVTRRRRRDGVPVSALSLVLPLTHGGEPLVALGSAHVADAVEACSFSAQTADAGSELAPLGTGAVTLHRPVTARSKACIRHAPAASEMAATIQSLARSMNSSTVYT